MQRFRRQTQLKQEGAERAKSKEKNFKQQCQRGSIANGTSVATAESAVVDKWSDALIATASATN